MPLSPAKAAEIAGCSRSLISRAVKSGDLIGIKENNRGHIKIERSDLDDWMARRTERATQAEAHPTPSQDTAPVTSHEDAVRVAALEVEIREVRVQLEDAKKDRDVWRAHAEQQAQRLSDYLASEAKSGGWLARLFGRTT